MNKSKLVNYLNEYLKHMDFVDRSKNWLQLDSINDEIIKIGYSVDSSTYIFDKAIEEKVDMILVHHGIFSWTKEEETLIWISYKRIKKLIDNNICLYVSHMPLDAHNEVWNNMWLLKTFVDTFNLKKKEYEIENFWEYQKQTIWFWIKFNREISVLDILIYIKKIGLQEWLYNFWNKEFIKSIAFVSWKSNRIKETYNKLYDLLITWELSHSDIVFAKELGQTILIWWHYETERFGPKLLAEHIEKKFGLEIVFLDEKY